MPEERSRNLSDKPQAYGWLVQHPDAKTQFDIAVDFLRSRYSGDNDGYVNIPQPQYRFNYKESGYVSVTGQVGAAIVKFGTERNSPHFEVRNEYDLVEISDFLNQYPEKYIGFNNDAVFKEKIKQFFDLSDYQIEACIDNSITESPQKTQRNVTQYVRSPQVVAERLRLAQGFCEGIHGIRCKHPAPFLKRSNNEPFLEVHHIIPLSKKGFDKVNNTAALCPNCHREVHDRLGMNPDDE